jgi:hypothetical protein
MTDQVKSAQESWTGEEDELRDIEHARLHALVLKDLETARRLHADDFQLVTPSGGTASKDEYLADVASGDVDYFVWEPISEIQVRLHGQAADIRYRSNLGIRYRGQESVGSYWHTDTYEKNNGQWQVVWSQATRIV